MRQHRTRPGIPVPQAGLRPDPPRGLNEAATEGGDTNARTLPMTLGPRQAKGSGGRHVGHTGLGMLIWPM